jgi:hypothetical protein
MCCQHVLTLAQRQTKYRKAKRERGECGWKGCDAKSGDDYHCPIHAAAHAARMKLARQKARVAA